MSECEIYIFLSVYFLLIQSIQSNGFSSLSGPSCYLTQRPKCQERTAAAGTVRSGQFHTGPESRRVNNELFTIHILLNTLEFHIPVVLNQ